MLDEKKMPKLSEAVLEKIKEMQMAYVPGAIAEVVERFKDCFCIQNEQNKDVREASINIINDIRDLCELISNEFADSSGETA